MSNSRDNDHAVWIGFFTGFWSGVADVAINYPPYGQRIRVQTQSAPASFKNLYLGAKPYAILTISSTIIQDGVTTGSKKFLPYNASKYYDAMAAMMGGVLSAFVATPMGNIIVKQQEKSLKPLKAIQELKAQGGWLRLSRGLSPTILRDAGYSGATFWGVTEAEKYLVKKFEISSYEARFSASLLVGVFTSFITQPFDTLATLLQNDSACKVTTWKKTKEIAKKDGVRGFFKGGGWRMISIFGGVYVMSVTSEKMKELIAKYRRGMF